MIDAATKPGAKLRWAKPDGTVALVLYRSWIGCGLAAVDLPGHLARQPTFAETSALALWKCDEAGHVVDTWEERATHADGSTVERGDCVVCGVPDFREQAMSERAERKIMCGTCEDTGVVKNLHQQLVGARGTRPCSACAPDPSRT